MKTYEADKSYKPFKELDFKIYSHVELYLTQNCTTKHISVTNRMRLYGWWMKVQDTKEIAARGNDLQKNEVKMDYIGLWKATKI